MENYVNLTLEKYNELYDKAKKFDGIIEDFEENNKNVTSSITKFLNNITNESEEEK